MKNILCVSAVFVLLLSGQFLLADSNRDSQILRRPPDRGGQQERMLTIYRVFNGRDHMMTLDQFEAWNVGYHSEGARLRLYANGGRGYAGIYRCRTRSNDHFESLDRRCEGQSRDFILGFAQQFQSREAPAAIFRCYKNGDHLTTLDENECLRAGYAVESILGYTR